MVWRNLGPLALGEPWSLISQTRRGRVKPSGWPNGSVVANRSGGENREVRDLLRGTQESGLCAAIMGMHR